jgi:hypothetical protein
MNKGRAYRIPGIGLAGDWPGAWTQTYAQVDTEAGAHGFDENYFVEQVAGLTQLAGELMLVKPLVIDLGWGALKTAIVGLKDASFITPGEATVHRGALLKMYVETFRRVEAGALAQARSGLNDLGAAIAARVVAADRDGLRAAADGLLAKM